MEHTRKPEAAATENPDQEKSQIDNTIGEVVGGATSAPVSVPGSAAALVGMLSLLNAPYPSSLPLYLADLHRDTVAAWTLPSTDPTYAQAAATHTWFIIKRTLMTCLRATKRERIAHLTAYVRPAMATALHSNWSSMVIAWIACLRRWFGS